MKLYAVLLAILLSTLLQACGRSKPEALKGESAESAEAPRGAADLLPLTPEQLKAAEVELAIAGPATLRDTLPLYGTVAPNAERMLEVSARFPGAIQSVQRKVGDMVREGETLATVESNESLQTYRVTSPLSGVVTVRNANPGEQTADKPLFVVADLSTVWVELSVFPRDASKVRQGQAVRVKSPDADFSADGKVVYVAPFGSSSSQSLTARVLLDNKDRRWAPGLYVTAEVTLAERQIPLAIRKSAIQMMDDKPTAFVQTEGGFQARKIQLGKSDGQIVEVLSGMDAGMTYAAENSYVLKAEALKSEADED